MEGHISVAQLKRARVTLACSTAWDAVAGKFNLPQNSYSWSQLPEWKILVYFLPPSFRQQLYIAGWKAQDVYRETHEQNREAARLRILDPVSRKEEHCGVSVT